MFDYLTDYYSRSLDNYIKVDEPRLLASFYFDEGKKNFLQKDFEKSRIYFEKAADMGHVDASTWVGLIYQYGEGVEIDLCKARHYYCMGAKEGPYEQNTFAFARLGRMYGHGIGGLIDREKAIECLKKAIHLGNPNAFLKLELSWQLRFSGEHTLADKWLAEYIDLEFTEKSKMTSELGGKLLSLCINEPDLENTIYELDSAQATGLSEKFACLSSLLEAEEVIPKGTVILKPNKLGGLCNGMVMEFIFTLTSKSGLSESDLQNLANRFAIRSGSTAVALQSIYQHLAKIPKPPHAPLPDSTITLSSRSTADLFLQKAVKDVLLKQAANMSEDTELTMRPIFKMYGQKIEAQAHLAIPGEYNDAEYLDQWEKSCPNGIYHLTLSTTSSTIKFSSTSNEITPLGPETYHAICLIKSQSHIYLWDPGTGLIKFPKKGQHTMISKYLAKIYPDVTINHELNIRRVVPIQKPSDVNRHLA